MSTARRDEIRSELRDALDRVSNGRAKLDRIKDDARIIEDVGLSSLDLLDLRCEMEERWQAEIADEEMMQLRTVGDVVQLIEKHTSSTL